MSRKWYVYCRTCREEGPGGDDFNKRPAAIQAAIRAAVPLGEAAKLLADHGGARLEIDFAQYLDLGFFAEHGAHDLAPRDEYGEFEP